MTTSELIAWANGLAEEYHDAFLNDPNDRIRADEVSEVILKITSAFSLHIEGLKSLAAKGGASGNCAAMRSALESVSDALLLWNYTDDDTAKMAVAQMQKCNIALTSPPRNCDRYDEHSIVDEFEKAMGKTASRTADEQDEYMKTNWFIFLHWLFAPASVAGEVGEGKGRR